MSELENFNDVCGGYNIYILNKPKPGEYKYTVVSTSGAVYKTNDKAEFMEYLNIKVLSKN